MGKDIIYFYRSGVKTRKDGNIFKDVAIVVLKM